uniref:Putative tick kunitz 46 n=1 Tax=Ixodes ricinus TaxID=34613 RepID=V5I2G4_IXORI
MKAIIAVTCIFSAIMLISAITREECEAQRPFSSCAPDVTPKVTYYFNNGTGQCEEDFGCGGGKNDFPSLEECKTKCPYGKYALPA